MPDRVSADLGVSLITLIRTEIHRIGGCKCFKRQDKAIAGLAGSRSFPCRL